MDFKLLHQEVYKERWEDRQKQIKRNYLQMKGKEIFESYSKF